MAIPAAFALPAIETILKEFSQRPGAASLALDVQQMHVPWEALITVPVRAHVTSAGSRNEWNLTICAASNSRMYPVFEGALKLLDAAAEGAQLQLEGVYVAPFGAIGRAIDVTLLRGIAESSLHRFVRDLANRVATLSHWTAHA